ncbi:MAG: sigma-70 family RNA polymerase sigma factor [Planctomycetota bacterium]|nr:sigma-70 family RNA polymerase sigma factor [Planctomycetota bacterium]
MAASNGLADDARRGEAIRLFAQFVREHEADVLNFVLRMVGNQDDAEEIAQEAFLRLYESLGKVEVETESYLAWVYRVARNLVIDHQRKRREAAMEEERIELTADEGAERPEDVYEHRTTALMVREALQDLPENYRECLVLRFQSELSYEQIAQVVGVPVSTIETRLHRAKRMLRARLKKMVGG